MLVGFRRGYAQQQDKFVDRRETQEDVIYARATCNSGSLSRSIVFVALALLAILAVSCSETADRGYIGVSFLVEEGSTIVTDVYLGGPSDIAGIEAEDKIFAIDEHDCTGASLEVVIDLLAGPPGSYVGIEVHRESTGENLDFLIKRVTSQEVGPLFAIHVDPESRYAKNKLELLRTAFVAAREQTLLALGQDAVLGSEDFEEFLSRVKPSSDLLFEDGEDSFFIVSWLEDEVGELWYGCAVWYDDGQWNVRGDPSTQAVTGYLYRMVDEEPVQTDFGSGYYGFPSDLRPEAYRDQDNVTIASDGDSDPGSSVEEFMEWMESFTDDEELTMWDIPSAYRTTSNPAGFVLEIEEVLDESHALGRAIPYGNLIRESECGFVLDNDYSNEYLDVVEMLFVVFPDGSTMTFQIGGDYMLLSEDDYGIILKPIRD